MTSPNQINGCVTLTLKLSFIHCLVVFKINSQSKNFMRYLFSYYSARHTHTRNLKYEEEVMQKS